MLDYTTLRIIWWLLLGVVLIGFAIMDGFDLGAVILLPFVTKTDLEKRILINSVGPTWEGNQVWFILGGGAIFAAWPYLYAAAFSGFYLAMFLVLTAFILRPVSFKYRSKMPGKTWRGTWDILLALSGFIPAVVFGVAVGNVLLGVPFHFDQMLRFYYSGHFWQLFRPFSLFCGLLSLFMLSMHGAIFLCNKTTDILQLRCRRAAIYCALITFTLFFLGGIWIPHVLSGYVILSTLHIADPSNPLHKVMSLGNNGWLANYQMHPLWWAAPACGLVGACLVIFFVAAKYYKIAIIVSSISLAGIISTVGLSMFPILLPSSENPSQSLLVWDASSSQLTLWLMLWAGIIFLPIILAYTSWVYRVMRGPVTAELFDQKEAKNLY